VQSLQSTAVGAIAAKIYTLNPASLFRAWQNKAMQSSEPQDPTTEKDVLTNLPRSRRQRPSVRREAARMSQASANTQAKASAILGDPQVKETPKPGPVIALPTAEPKRRSSIPRAGYATPNHGKNFGNADPAGLLTELTRAALRLLPG
jgi:hypothetical protein